MSGNRHPATVAPALFALVLLLAGSPAAPATAQEPAPGVDDPRFDEARAFILRHMQEDGVPSVSVAAARGGEVVWEEAFGWADVERRVPATPHTAYSLASISKPITATGLMVLVERGDVSLDRPANDYLGIGRLTGLAGDASEATVRRVLSHTAGLPLHYQFFYEGTEYRRPPMEETIDRYGILVNPPGEQYRYSNLGFGILDHIIARVSGRSYADFMRTEVFMPLGLTRTSVGIAPRMEAFVAERYDGDLKPIPFYDFDHRGASAVYSSAHDLVRFGMFHLGDGLPEQRRILSGETIDRMQNVQTGDLLDDGGYGLGWSIGDGEGPREVGHGGGMPGVATRLLLYPTEDVAIVVLTNRSGSDVREIAARILEALVPDYEAPSAGEGGGSSGRERFTAPDELLGTWTGALRTWERELPLRLVFQEDGDVHARIGGQLVTLLNDARWEDGNLEGRFNGRIPTRDAGRKSHMVRLDLHLRDGVLGGQASAQDRPPLLQGALTSYVELRREE